MNSTLRSDGLPLQRPSAQVFSKYDVIGFHNTVASVEYRSGALPRDLTKEMTVVGSTPISANT